MRIAAELTGPVSIVRVAECDCTVCLGGEMEPHVFLIASIPGRERLWATVGQVAESEWAEKAEPVMGETTLDGVPTNAVIEVGLALVGMTWDRLTPQRAMHQMAWWYGAPEWMRNTARGELWACRAAVFGNDVTRVPRALFALEGFYRPDAPVRMEDLGVVGRAVDGPPDVG